MGLHLYSGLFVFCFIALISSRGGFGYPEPGRWTKQLSSVKNSTIAWASKIMYRNTSVVVRVRGVECERADTVLTVRWVLRHSDCAEKYEGMNETLAREVFDKIRDAMLGEYESGVQYQEGAISSKDGSCGSGGQLYPASRGPWVDVVVPSTAAPVVVATTTGTTEAPSRAARDVGVGTGSRVTNTPESTDNPEGTNKPESTNKPEGTDKPESTDNPASTDKPEGTAKPVPTPTDPGASATDSESSSLPNKVDADPTGNRQSYEVTRTPESGPYLLIVVVDTHSDVNLTLDISMIDADGPDGSYVYLSASDFPLSVFYGVMCAVYVVFSLAWLIMCALYWKDILRVQFWICGVLLLGMIEKAFFEAEYQRLRIQGSLFVGSILIAEIVSVAKRTLARMLVIIVSIGFGIVKPRLGAMLHRVLAIGGLYFLVASVECFLRAMKPKETQSTEALIAAIPLAVIDSIICWWVFTSLVQTLRTLRLRRNLVKLSLYRHFTNTLIFAVLVSVIYMIWSIKMHKFVNCLTDWAQLWVDEAFWHLLFSVILLVIMILWRPSANNQRYAFSPLVDAVDDESEEPFLGEAFDTVKMRQVSNGSASRAGKNTTSTEDEDLRWVEENIPSSMADVALPTLLDSDEEILTTRYEVSKMQ